LSLGNPLTRILPSLKTPTYSGVSSAAVHFAGEPKFPIS
jgi:hypothetical protein